MIDLDVDNSEVFTGRATTLHLALREESRHETRPIQPSGRPDSGAIARARCAIDGYGSLICSACHRSFPPSEIDVDHRVPLDAGGMDCDANVLLICKDCHRELPTAGHDRN